MAIASLSPFSPLVLSNRWETSCYNLNSAYTYLLPAVGELHSPHLKKVFAVDAIHGNFDLQISLLAHTQRPGLGAGCISLIRRSQICYELRQYRSSQRHPKVSRLRYDRAMANAFDGIRATPVHHRLHLIA